MKIAIDLSQIIYGTGVSHYRENLVRNLLKINKQSLASGAGKENEYLLYGGSLRRKKELEQKKKEAEVIGKAVVMTAAKVSEDFLKSKITSLSIAELRSVLSEYPQVELVRVKFFPPLLLSSIPSNERNVTIKINYIEQSLSLGAWDLNTG